MPNSGYVCAYSRINDKSGLVEHICDIFKCYLFEARAPAIRQCDTVDVVFSKTLLEVGLSKAAEFRICFPLDFCKFWIKGCICLGFTR